jgi:hypothetical protein
MSVDQPKTIDFVGIDKSTGDVVLTISDHLDWTDSNNHQLILQKKINSYLSFIESGEIFESYPDSKGRHPVISVVSQYAPDTDGREFPVNVKSAVEEAGIGFQFRSFSDAASH